jgi:hydrogenase maturation protease
MAAMAGCAGARVVVIGVGNDFRSDDGVGRAVARALAGAPCDGMAVMEHTGEVAGLLEAWKDADTAILLDAVVTGAGPGTIHRFDGQAQAIPGECFPCSTHAFGIPEAIALGRAVGVLPRRLVIIGVEARTVAPGRGLSREVERAVPEVVARVRREAEAARRRAPAGGE